jgi:pimeloyl-ACP methyl ester carboxylesterase
MDEQGAAGDDERLQMRATGEGNRPTLIYLPGIHGDWTLVGGFKRTLGGQVRFVEFIYPRTLVWSLDDYARAVEEALAAQGITRGWIVGESFGSQVTWALLRRRRFHAEGVILAGGFVKHPLPWGVRWVEHWISRMSIRSITRILAVYAKIARFRFRKSPETVAAIHEFIARRTDLDRRAVVHRLRLIAAHDPRLEAREAAIPIYAMTGGVDPVVPWVLTRPWLKRHCAALREFKVIWGADHNVLGTAPEAAAELALRWVGNEAKVFSG